MLVAVGVLLYPATIWAAFGINPGKVYIENLYPGAEADVPITIYNQSDSETTFEIRARKPDYTAEGYEAFPHLDWITITPDQVTIKSRGQSQVMVIIIMPKDADYSGKKAETWISFKEKDAPGMIQIEIASRLFISTRVEATSDTSVEGNGAVEITAEAEEPVATMPDEEAEPVAPMPDEETEPVAPLSPGEAVPATPLSPWAIAGPVLGAVLIGGATFFWARHRQHI